jgi:hypothetical protein
MRWRIFACCLPRRTTKLVTQFPKSTYLHASKDLARMPKTFLLLTYFRHLRYLTMRQHHSQNS